MSFKLLIVYSPRPHWFVALFKFPLAFAILKVRFLFLFHCIHLQTRARSIYWLAEISSQYWPITDLSVSADVKEKIGFNEDNAEKDTLDDL